MPSTLLRRSSLDLPFAEPFPLPRVYRVRHAVRLVRSVSRATRTVAQRLGPRAARAIPRAVQAAGRTARRRRLPARAVPQAVRRTVARVARSPQLVRRLARGAGRGMGARAGMGMGAGAIGRVGPRGARSFQLRGPVRITIHGR